MRYPFYRLSLFTLFIFISQSFFSQAQEYDEEVLQKIADKACSCLDEVDLDKTDFNEANQFMEQCMQSAMMANFADLMAMDMSSEEDGKRLGMAVAKVLFKSCPRFVDFSMRLAEQDDNQESTSSEEDFQQEGTIKGIEENELAYLIVESQGKTTKFLWLRPFSQSGEMMQNFQNFVGKAVRVSWKYLEIYDPRSRKYVQAREIRGITITE